MINKQWYLLRHITDHRRKWYPVKCWSFFGYPLCTFFFVARGPYKTREEAMLDKPLKRKIK